tara:strand:- start:53 stop:367 length:315 start_codon:yes stop_codon:yes gene_type:complete
MEDLPELLKWDDVTSYEDLLTPREIEIIEELEGNYPLSQHCPHLEKEGDHYYHCGAKPTEGTDRTLGPTSRIYNSHIGIMELQLWCLDGEERYEKCIFYPENEL